MIQKNLLNIIVLLTTVKNALISAPFICVPTLFPSFFLDRLPCFTKPTVSNHFVTYCNDLPHIFSSSSSNKYLNYSLISCLYLKHSSTLFSAAVYFFSMSLPHQPHVVHFTDHYKILMYNPENP